MANHASALKAHRQSIRRRNRNRSHRSALRTALKVLSENVTAGKGTDAPTTLPQIYSKVDRAVRKGVLSKNAASRHKSRISKRFNTAAPVGS